MRRPDRLLVLVSLALSCLGCAGHRASVLSLDLAHTRPAGTGPAFRPPPMGHEKPTAGAPIDSLFCGRRRTISYGAHIELFAEDRGVVVPAGIGVMAPQHRGPFVVGGRCLYPLRTLDPTGVIQVDRPGLSGTPTVGEFFAVWGEPLTRKRLASFAGAVVGFVNGHRWPGDPGAIPLRRHTQVVLELGAFVLPHGFYTFPPGL
jgi:hypothetical protein